MSRNGRLDFTTGAAETERGFDATAFGRLAEIEGTSAWFGSRNRLIGWAIRTYFPASRRAHEIGCGTGFVLRAIRDLLPDCELTGSDVFSEGLDIAQARVPSATLYQLDATRLPFRSEWDLVGAFDVLEHIPEDGRVLEELYRAATPGAGLVLTVPQHPTLWSGQDVAAHHVRRYARGQLEAKVERAGFRVMRSTSFVTLPLPALVLTRRHGPSDVGYGTEVISHHPAVEATLGMVLAVERVMIAAGISAPIGGSRLVVARKPVAA